MLIDMCPKSNLLHIIVTHTTYFGPDPSPRSTHLPYPSATFIGLTAVQLRTSNLTLYGRNLLTRLRAEWRSKPGCKKTNLQKQSHVTLPVLHAIKVECLTW